MRFLVLGLSAAIMISAPAWAASKVDTAEKERQCQFQGDLMGAVQQARLDRVKKAKASETVLAANPDWPEGVADALPAIVEYVWGFTRRDLKKVDLAQGAKDTCLENYEEIQKLQKTVTN